MNRISKNVLCALSGFSTRVITGIVLLLLVVPVTGCQRAETRSERRAYDGAPPVIPHPPFSASCGFCHAERSMRVPGVGFSPALPHEKTPGMGAMSRCEQCHVYSTTREVFRQNDFSGLKQDLRRGERMYPGAPPTVPHLIFMRENCFACHTGHAAREEIRSPHPERMRCLQCHMGVQTEDVFSR